MNAHRGFSTLEMLIAMTVLLMAFAATMMLLPGVQNNSVDTEVAVEALNMVDKTLENEQALARKDFKLVVATSSSETIGNLTYQKQVDVVSTDYFTKQVTATVSWTGMYGRAQSMTLKTVVSNFEEAVGGDTCDSAAFQTWNSLPLLPSKKNLGGDIMGDASGNYPITDLDAYRQRLYVTVNNTGTLPVAGPRDAGTAVNDTSAGTIGWGTPTSARTSDNSYATASLNSGNTSNYLKVTNFGFTSAMIPNDATIIGIKVDIERKGSSNTNTVRDSSVRIVRADGTLGGTNQAHATSWPTTDASDSYGSASDLWNETSWSPAAIRSANFGVAVSATTNGGSGIRTASVDDVRITITYTRQFYVLNATAPANPTFDRSLGQNPVSQGFTSVAIATSTTAGSYAYVTTASTTAQFQVLNIANNPVTVTSTYKIPNATGLIPNTVFYKDGYAYVGLPNNGSGDEFVIIDVHTPASIPAPLATYPIGAGVNAIYVKGGYAFVATDNPTKELVVLDLNDLAHPALRGIYNASGSDTSTFGLGKSLYTVGDTLYFGRYYISSDPEFNILDTTTAVPTLLGSLNTGTSGNTAGIYNIIGAVNRAVALSGNTTGGNAQLLLLNIANTGSISQLGLASPLSGAPAGLDCERNPSDGKDYFYAATVTSNKGAIYTITGS